MKNKILIILIFISLFVSNSIFSEELVLKGVYQGKDLYIVNPMLDLGEEYCAYEVLVNDKIFDADLNSSAFKISLEYAGIKFGEEYKVLIKHHDNCKPHLVNPEVLKPLSSFELIDYKFSDDNMFSFTTHKESGKLTFYVEQLKWNKWVKVGEVEGLGGPDDRTYSIKLIPCNGKNNLRVYQVDHLNRRLSSDTLSFNVDKEAIVITSRKKCVKKEITFSGETNFEVINQFGEELISGSGNTVDVSNLEKGEYFLNYDNKYIVFKKR